MKDQDWGTFTPLIEGIDPAAVQAPTAGQRDPLVTTHPAGNPCVAVFGAGPEGATCAGCCHLHKVVYSRAVYKCDERPISGGAGTDHRRRWPACARYTPGAPTTHHMSH